MKAPKPFDLLKEAEGLVQFHGYVWSCGAPTDASRGKFVVKALADRYMISQRHCRRLLSQAKAHRSKNSLPMKTTYASGLAAAYAGKAIRSSVPAQDKLIPSVSVPATPASSDVVQQLRQSLVAFLKSGRATSRQTIELAQALLEEFPKI